MRRLSALAVSAGVVAVSAGSVVEAEATSGYRYWSYYHAEADGWAYSQVRMDNHVPDDGAVEGWRFVTAEFGDTERAPRTVLSFDDVCGGTDAAEGSKRIALIVDFGRDADAADGETPPQPRAACAVVDEDATTAMALSSVAGLRIDDARLCGVDGYPSAGCNEAVDPLPQPAAEPDDVVAIEQVAGAVGEQAAGDGGAGSDEGAGGAGAGDEATGVAAADDDAGSAVSAWAGAAVAAVAVVGAVVAVRRSRRT